MHNKSQIPIASGFISVCLGKANIKCYGVTEMSLICVFYLTVILGTIRNIGESTGYLDTKKSHSVYISKSS